MSPNLSNGLYTVRWTGQVQPQFSDTYYFDVVRTRSCGHRTIWLSNDQTGGLEISGIRILYNAFLNWRRAPLSLHNATDANVIGNYFGPPLTNDGYAPLTNDVIADLGACDYPNLRFTNNVNATTLPDNHPINENGTNAAVTLNAFRPPVASWLAAHLSGANLLVNWA